MKSKNLNLRSSRLLNFFKRSINNDGGNTSIVNNLSTTDYCITPTSPQSCNNVCISIDSNNPNSNNFCSFYACKFESGIDFSDYNDIIEVEDLSAYRAYRLTDIFGSFLKYLGIQSNQCTKLNLSNVISPDPIVEALYDEKYVFNIKFYEKTTYYYRYQFANDNEKDRFKKLFDQDGYATITLEKDNSTTTTQKGKSPNLFMRKKTNSNLSITNIYTIKAGAAVFATRKK